MLSGCVFSSNAYAFIENLKNQINSTVFNHTCYKLFLGLIICLKFFKKYFFNRGNSTHLMINKMETYKYFHPDWSYIYTWLLLLGQSQWEFLEGFLTLNTINFVDMARREKDGVSWGEFHQHKTHLAHLSSSQSR